MRLISKNICAVSKTIQANGNDMQIKYISSAIKINVAFIIA
jgi:hypothetical protein